MFKAEDLPPGQWTADITKHPEMQHLFMHATYRCEVVRNAFTYTYCGYVQLPRHHPDYAKTYHELEDHINVHGGLTYGEGNGKFGFDCHHVIEGDVSPADACLALKSADNPFLASLFNPRKMSLTGRTHYWNFEEAKRETECMADQFHGRE
jgi:hypothetical protein